MKIKNKNWICVDCKKDTFLDPKDYYMVTDELWNKFGVGKNMLCIGCLESRLGRKIKAEDLILFPINFINPYTKKILYEKN